MKKIMWDELTVWDTVENDPLIPTYEIDGERKEKHSSDWTEDEKKKGRI